ncbi:hypothetical protein DFH09DRAFT_1081002 [Mycena vulgaris]|nr:hypothetical protein DFH09DRAFT_1081002 [Mycena vulgaris]
MQMQRLIEAGVAPGLFTIQNIVTGTFLSSTGAIAGLNPTATQLCGHERAFQWNITVNGNKFKSLCRIMIPQPRSSCSASLPGTMTVKVWFQRLNKMFYPGAMLRCAKSYVPLPTCLGKRLMVEALKKKLHPHAIIPVYE